MKNHSPRPFDRWRSFWSKVYGREEISRESDKNIFVETSLVPSSLPPCTEASAGEASMTYEGIWDKATLTGVNHVFRGLLTAYVYQQSCKSSSSNEMVMKGIQGLGQEHSWGMDAAQRWSWWREGWEKYEIDISISPEVSFWVIFFFLHSGLLLYSSLAERTIMVRSYSASVRSCFMPFSVFSNALLEEIFELKQLHTTSDSKMCNMTVEVVVHRNDFLLQW